MEATITNLNIAVPQELTDRKAEFETILTNITAEETKLAGQRKDVQAALNNIMSCIAVLTGQPMPVAPGTTVRKPMSEEAKKRIAEGLRKSREAKAALAIAASDGPVDGKSAAANDNTHAEAEAIANAPEVLAEDATVAPKTDTPKRGAAAPQKAKAGK